MIRARRAAGRRDVVRVSSGSTSGRCAALRACTALRSLRIACIGSRRSSSCVCSAWQWRWCAPRLEGRSVVLARSQRGTDECDGVAIATRIRRTATCVISAIDLTMSRMLRAQKSAMKRKRVAHLAHGSRRRSSPTTRVAPPIGPSRVGVFVVLSRAGDAADRTDHR